MIIALFSHGRDALEGHGHTTPVAYFRCLNQLYEEKPSQHKDVNVQLTVFTSLSCSKSESEAFAQNDTHTR